MNSVYSSAKLVDSAQRVESKEQSFCSKTIPGTYLLEDNTRDSVEEGGKIIHNNYKSQHSRTNCTTHLQLERLQSNEHHGDDVKATKDFLDLGQFHMLGETGTNENFDACKDSEGREKEAKLYESTFSFFHLNRKQKRFLFCNCAADVLLFLSTSVMLPFFPKEASEKNVSNTVSGWIFCSGPLVQVIFGIFSGQLAPKIGIVFMYRAGLFVTGGCTLLMGFLTYVTDTLPFIILAFALQIVRSIGQTSTSTVTSSMLCDEFPNDISKVVGLSELCVAVGLMAGPGVGSGLYAIGGFLLPFATFGSLCVVFLLFSWNILEDVRNDVLIIEEAEVFNWKSSLLRSPLIVINSLSLVLAAVNLTILSPTLEPHLRKFSLNPEEAGLVFLLLGVVYGLFAPIIGCVADRMCDGRKIILCGFVISCVALVFLGPSPLLGIKNEGSMLWLVILCVTCLGIAVSFTIVPTFDLYLQAFKMCGFETDVHTYAAVSGLWLSLFSLGEFIGPFAAGVMMDYFGFEWLVTATAALDACLVLTIAASLLCDTG